MTKCHCVCGAGQVLETLISWWSFWERRKYYSLATDCCRLKWKRSLRRNWTHQVPCESLSKLLSYVLWALHNLKLIHLHFHLLSGFIRIANARSLFPLASITTDDRLSIAACSVEVLLKTTDSCVLIMSIHIRKCRHVGIWQWLTIRFTLLCTALWHL